MITVFMENPEMDRDAFIESLIAKGRIAEADCDRVFIVRHMTEAEADALRPESN